MKQNRRVLSCILVICMIVALLPVVASAANGTVSAVGMGTDALKDGQYLNFAGSKWLIADADGANNGEDGVLLLSTDTVGEPFAYNENGTGSSWSTSAGKAWCTNYLSNFTSAQKAVMLTVSKSASSANAYGVDWAKDALSDEVVFFLSAEEVEACFGGNALVGTAFNTDTGWWLRSVNKNQDIMAGVVSDSGFVGAPHVATKYAARPAFNLDASKIALVTASAKPASFGAVSTVADPVWNLTLLNSAKAFSASTTSSLTTNTGYSKWSVSVSYSGAASGDKICAALCDQMGNVLYYGPVTNSVTSASGTATVNLPAGLDGKYLLRVFAETSGAEFDYASNYVEFALFADRGNGSIDSWNLVLNDNISANFWVDLPGASADVTVTVNNITNTYPDVADGDYFTVDLAAAQMGDTMFITIDNGNGNVSATYQYSIRQYADMILSGEYDAYLEKDPELSRELVKAMLGYGGAAQNYFGYNTDVLADEGIVVTQQVPENNGYAADLEDGSSVLDFAGASLVHETRTAVRFYLTSDTDLTTVPFMVEFFGLDDEYVLENVYPVAKGSMYYIEIDGINPYDLDCYVDILDDSGEFFVGYSPMYYIERMYHRSTSSSALKNLMGAMYTYYLAASEYYQA